MRSHECMCSALCILTSRFKTLAAPLKQMPSARRGWRDLRSSRRRLIWSSRSMLAKVSSRGSDWRRWSARLAASRPSMLERRRFRVDSVLMLVVMPRAWLALPTVRARRLRAMSSSAAVRVSWSFCWRRVKALRRVSASVVWSSSCCAKPVACCSWLRLRASAARASSSFCFSTASSALRCHCWTAS